ncbi:MAG TPA: LamG domain-containing protein [Thermoplasmatales archaeon]|nr:LamG domain-containing protein [Thermoplasmatales archaeon]
MPRKIFRKVLEGRSGKAKLTAALIALGLLAMPFVLLLTNEANAATVLTEDMEDITEWTQGSAKGYADVVQTSWTKYEGTYSVHITGDNSFMEYNITSLGVNDSSLTLSFWIYRNNTADLQYFVTIQDFEIGDTTNNRFNIQVTADGYYRVSGNDDGGAFTEFGASTTTCPTGQWVHLTFVMDGGTATLYAGTTELFNFTYTTGTTFTHLYVGEISISSSQTNDQYVDYLTLSNTADYPSTPSETIDITLSGYDANNITWFADVTVTNSTGNTSWTNQSTTYKYIIVENTGTANISNLTMHLEMFSFGGTIEVYSNRTGSWTLEGSLNAAGDIAIISNVTPPNGLETGEKWWFIFKVTVPAGTADGTYYTGGTSTPDCYITVS